MLKIGDKSVLKDGREFKVVPEIEGCDGCVLYSEDHLCESELLAGDNASLNCGYGDYILIATDSPKQYTTLFQVQEEIKAHTKKIEELTQVMLGLSMSEDNEDYD